jgi:DNA-binding transcriptional MerR regulator
VFHPGDGQRYLVELVGKEVVLVSYAPKLAAALLGATIRQLAYWRKPGPDGQPILAPEYSATRPIDYSFRDVVALRTCVRLRQEASLQKIRRALDTLRVDLGLREHLSSHHEFFPRSRLALRATPLTSHLMSTATYGRRDEPRESASGTARRGLVLGGGGWQPL